jgi:hypothetical protein
MDAALLELLGLVDERFLSAPPLPSHIVFKRPGSFFVLSGRRALLAVILSVVHQVAGEFT